MMGPGEVGAAAPGIDASLEAWLDWIDGVHPSDMELGLERVSRVAARLGIAQPAIPVVIVGGTNGKGSTVAMLESIWTAAGYRTGAATSPHVVHFGERMRVGGEAADDDAIVHALAAVERGRFPADGAPADALTYFEFATLASMVLFLDAGCDVAIMEVGLGGRLDAVNLWDADCAVLTSIALDHADWLGTDLSVIATEKAAIARPGRRLIVGEPSPPASLGAFAEARGVTLVSVGARAPESLPVTSLPGVHQRRNAGCALEVISALSDRLPLDEAAAHRALAQVAVPSRFEQREVDGVPLVIDVAHNPAAATALVQAWQERLGSARALAVFSALADKDIESLAGITAPIIEQWYCTATSGPRTLPVVELESRVRAGLSQAGVEMTQGVTARYESMELALDSALRRAADTSQPVLVFGSFVTVSAAHTALKR